MPTLRERIAAALAALRGRLPQPLPAPPAGLPDLSALRQQADSAHSAVTVALDAVAKARASLDAIAAAAAKR